MQSPDFRQAACPPARRPSPFCDAAALRPPIIGTWESWAPIMGDSDWKNITTVRP
jgi:hypothetical protein